MWIMIDTNVLISASLFANSRIAQAIKILSNDYSIVLCSAIIDELHSVYSRKFPNKMYLLEGFLNALSYELVYTSKWQENMHEIRDEKDKPILASAILADVDILLTGDKDFSDIDIERPEILTPNEFLARY